MKSFDIYCAGKFVHGPEQMKVTDKFSGDVFATTWLADTHLLEKAIAAARKALKNAPAPTFERASLLRRVSERMAKEKTVLAEILARESGKPLYLASAEIDRSVQTFLVASEECKRIAGDYMSLDWTPAGKGREGIVRYFPAGVVAGISPFNFPMNLAVHKIAPALAAGCPIILKPASATPLSTLSLAKILHEEGAQEGTVSILPMTRETGNLLATHDGIDILSFTGSPVVGWKLKEQSGKKKVILELGGNAGVIVTSSADVSAIMDKCVAGAFAYSGQICIHAQRFFVHERHFDSFVTLMKTRAAKLKFGDPSKEDTRISVMIDDENAKRVESWVNDAVKKGAVLHLGGTRDGRYVPPTILSGTDSSMSVYQEEVFGPVICIERFSELTEAIERLNEGHYGLQCGVFTDSVKELDEVFRRVQVGGVIHNDVPTLRFDHMPYGGVKDSGLGREGVKYAMMDMLEPRILVK